MNRLRSLLLLGSLHLPALTQPADLPVDADTMQRIYNEVKTPFKYGVILKGESPDELVDCPSIFRHGDQWYMMYVAISNHVGYQTFLARSDDLRRWEKLGKILSFTKPGDWDAWQADGGIALCDHRWDASHELDTFQGKYWMSYIGGALQGYETDPLSIVEPSEPFDETYAHKPWLVKWNDDVYHFYCAVGNQGRVIALATSRDLSNE